MLSLIPFEELASILEKLDKVTTPGYHRTYYKTELKRAISAFERLGLMKYLFCAPRYRQLIEKAKAVTAK